MVLRETTGVLSQISNKFTYIQVSDRPETSGVEEMISGSDLTWWESRGFCRFGWEGDPWSRTSVREVTKECWGRRPFGGVGRGVSIHPVHGVLMGVVTHLGSDKIKDKWTERVRELRFEDVLSWITHQLSKTTVTSVIYSFSFLPWSEGTRNLE